VVVISAQQIASQMKGCDQFPIVAGADRGVPFADSLVDLAVFNSKIRKVQRFFLYSLLQPVEPRVSSAFDVIKRIRVENVRFRYGSTEKIWDDVIFSGSVNDFEIKILQPQDPSAQCAERIVERMEPFERVTVGDEGELGEIQVSPELFDGEYHG
jgi:ABC-type multidrug transport system fused ATPase/permease subunit